VTPRVTIFDYGAGNLQSLGKALALAGADVRITTDPAGAARATDALVLPGVGAFAGAAERLAPGRDAMRAAVAGGLPCLGVCLGMQLLFDGSDEGPGEGLGLVPGRVTPLRAARVPQIGWNSIDGPADPLFDAAPVAMAYYANSYVCRPTDSAVVAGWSPPEGDRFAAAVRSGSAIGVQFHPEKSSAAGVAFIRAFIASIGR
jgi:glutamine amidotransferase